MVIKRGDTLIEVALAIGIFSMVAVAVVAVVGGSTSSAQSALEITIAREEIDAQAEALRFIQSSYIAGGNTSANATNSTNKYAELWQSIVSEAVDLSNKTDEEAEKVLLYNPSTCENLNDSEYLSSQGAFVINPRALGINYSSTGIFSDFSETAINQIVIRPSSSNSKFQSAATYPRLVYGNSGDALIDLETKTQNIITGVEGIYVIAVKDNRTTTVVNVDDNNIYVEGTSAYYDFYIRTCWFAPGSERPSTISTVIRLQDPNVIKQDLATNKVVKISGNGNNKSPTEITVNPSDYASGKVNLSNYKNSFAWDFGDIAKDCTASKFSLAGWSTNPNAKWSDTSSLIPVDGDYTVTGATKQTVYAIWKTDCPCCSWVDVNASKASSTVHSNTSGIPGFGVKVLVNGKTIDGQSAIDWDISSMNRQILANETDWYNMVPLGSKISVYLLGKKNAKIYNFDSICNGIINCKIYEIQNNSLGITDYVMTMPVLPQSLYSEKDSSGHYSIRIEPWWVCSGGLSDNSCF